MVDWKHMQKIFIGILALLFLSLHSIYMHKNKHYVFVSASYNNAEWCERSLQSVFMQKYPHWPMIYIDDCSTDGTGNIVTQCVTKFHMQDRVTIIQNTNRMGHCYNQYHAIHSCPDDAIIIILDGDDWLAHDNVLCLLNRVYQQDVWITYGQFKHFTSKAFSCSCRIPEYVMQMNGIRDYPRWITSHMRTFLRRLI